LKDKMQREGGDVFLVSNLKNIRYLCGFTGSSGFLAVTEHGTHFFSDGRYRTQAADEVIGAEVRIYGTAGDFTDMLKTVVQATTDKVAYESAHTTVVRGQMGAFGSGKDDIEKCFPDHELVQTKGWVEALRRLKEPAEIDLIRTAAQMADEGFSYIVDQVVPGKTEHELALDLEFHMRSLGADDVSFEPIVAAAERSALPHAHPTQREVEKGRFLLFDLGCIYKGYCSDLTRTIVIGPLDDRHREIYDLVAASEQAGLDAIRPGVMARDADRAARDVIEAAGHKDAFGHGLGHGVGIEIHEEPRLGGQSEDVLEQGHVVTCEPGAYFAGWGGVRVEDLLLVTDQGNEVLSHSSKELIVL
ncbi:MAG: aminopeptidase P family protein, partial [Actinomycetota bacterium]